MKKIETISELKSERLRLMKLKMKLEVEIENDFNEVKYYFSPTRFVPTAISKLVVNNSHGILNEVISLLVNLLLKKGILRNAGFIAKLIIPMLTRNAVGNIVTDNKVKILSWLENLLSKNKNHKRRENTIYDQSTVDFYN